MVPKLDLHGVRHHEVPNSIAKFVWKYRKHKDALHVITGHSCIMKKTVKECLQLYAIRRIEEGDILNKGYLKVWLDN
jgi:DNA-nicking Smr family endonuclease